MIVNVSVIVIFNEKESGNSFVSHITIGGTMKAVGIICLSAGALGRAAVPLRDMRQGLLAIQLNEAARRLRASQGASIRAKTQARPCE